VGFTLRSINVLSFSIIFHSPMPNVNEEIPL
jgi:hypothetical protein